MVKNRRYEDKDSGFGVRHLQIFLLFFALTVGFAMRVNLSVAIVAITELPEFNWSSKVKSLVLSSFFWGYIITQIPAGLLARRFGGKVTILTGVSICSVLTVLTPLCVRLGDWKLLCAVRLLEGLSQGVLFPSCHTVISAWVLPTERGSMGNFTYSGNIFGTIVMLASSGLMVSLGGWPCIFYISGLIGCLWSLIFYVWGASSPAESKKISDEERELIQLGQASERPPEAEQPNTQQATPWKGILTSPAVLALLLTQSAYAYGFYTLLTQLPSYMGYILKKDIKANALLSSIPYVAMILLSFCFAWLSKTMEKKGSTSLSFNRKLFNTIGFWGPAFLLIALCYVPQSMDTMAVILLTLIVSMCAAAHVGFLVNHIDLTPNFAGILMGVCNCVANMMSLMAPIVVGIVVTDQYDVSQWRMVFYIAAGILFVGNCLFLIVGRTNVQSWNEPTPVKGRRESVPEIIA